MATSTTALRMLVVAACLMGGWAYVSRAALVEAVPLREPLASVPMNVGDWTGRRMDDFDARTMRILGVDEYILRQYERRGSLPIGVYVGYYASQRQGDSIHSPMNCLPGAGWQPTAQSRVWINVRPSASAPADTAVEMNRVVITKGLDRQLVLYWYQSRRRIVASEYWGKIYTVIDAIRYHQTDAALVRVISPIADAHGGIAGADRRATTFVQTFFPLLGRHLPQ